jgi:MerR family transcriptional regulator, light-induced transcriptional regulator
MLSEHADEYLAAVRSGSRTAAADLLIRLSDAGIPPLEIYEHVVSATQRRIGELWQEGRLTVAQEHVATAVTEFALARLYAYLEPPDAYRGSAVVCGVQGELHQVGARIVADALEFDGWSVAFLGTNLPAQDVVEFAIAHDATLAALSVTYDANVPNAAALITALRKAVPRLRIVVGGRPFTATAGLWRSVGADASGTDLRSAQQAAIGHN